MDELPDTLKLLEFDAQNRKIRQRIELPEAQLRVLADDAGLDPQFAEKFLTFIIAEVIHHHEARLQASNVPSPVAADR